MIKNKLGFNESSFNDLDSAIEFASNLPGDATFFVKQFGRPSIINIQHPTRKEWRVISMFMDKSFLSGGGGGGDSEIRNASLELFLNDEDSQFVVVWRDDE